MTFEELHSDTTCNCLEGASPDTTSTFVRYLAKGKLRDADFKSKWEKEHRATDCDDIRGLKGVSVSKVEKDEHLEEVISDFKEIFSIAPKYKSAVCVFNGSKGVGYFKFRKSDVVRYHHELYKCDGFNIDKLSVINIVTYS